MGIIFFRLPFTPLEKATDFNRWSSSLEADGGLKPPSAQAVREWSSLTGFTVKINGHEEKQEENE